MSLDEQFGVGAVLDEMVKEREYQNQRWGRSFDDRNTVNDWATYTNQYMGRATTMGATKAEQRAGMLKAATILLAAVEVFDRNGGFAPRHYDMVTNV